MASSCIIHPRIKGKDGEFYDSVLFSDLKVSFKGAENREKLVDNYLKIKKYHKENPGFFEIDDLGEPMLSDVLLKTNLIEEINIDELKKNITNDERYSIGKEYQPSVSNLKMLEDKVFVFNSTSPYRNIFTLRIERNTNNKYSIKIEDNNIGTVSRASEKQDVINKVNQKINLVFSNKTSDGNWLYKLKNNILQRTGDINKVYNELIDGLKKVISFTQNKNVVLTRELSDFLFTLRKKSIYGEYIENPEINRIRNYIGSEAVNFYNNIMNDAVESVTDEQLLDAIKKSFYFYNIGRDFTVSGKEDFYKTYYKKLNDFKRWLSDGNIFDESDISKINNLETEIIENKDSVESTIFNAPKVDLTGLELNEGEMFQTSDPEIMEKILYNEAKKLNIMKKSHYKESDIEKQQFKLQTLEKYLNEGKINDGLMLYIKNVKQTMQLINKRLNETNENLSSNEKARKLRSIKRDIDSIKFITNDLVEYYTKKKGEGFEDEIAMDLINSVGYIFTLEQNYKEQAKPIVIAFLKDAMGREITVPYGKKIGQKISIEELIKKSDKDVGFIEMYLDSVANCSDELLRILDKKVKMSRHGGRQETLDIMHEIKDAAYKLEKAGYETTEWMISKVDKKRYISKYDTEKYTSEYNSFISETFQKYSGEIQAGNMVNYEREVYEWKKAHKIEDYISSEYKSLSSAQKEYYNKFMELKDRLDKYIGNKDTANRIFVRKDLLERIHGVTSFKELKDEVVKTFEDSFKYRLDDDDFGTNIVMSYDKKKQVEFLPIYFTHLDRNISIDDISTDATSCLVSYAAMATDFKSMVSIINEMEITRDLLYDRKITGTVGNNKLSEKVAGMSRDLTIYDSNFKKLLDEFYSSQVYGRYFKDTGTFGNTNISKQKAASNLASLTSIQKLGVNLLAGISNIITGSVMMRIESIAGQYFKYKDVVWADKLYMSEINGVLGDIGHRQLTSKLGLFSEKFDVLQKFKEDTRDIDWDNKSIFRKLFNTNSLFFINNVGEHWMQNRTALAVASNYKLKLNGKTINLWDAYEVQFTDKSDKRAGAKLVLKHGVTKENGEEFTENDVFEITRKIAGINHRLHGIYNKEDMNAFQRLGIGRLAMQFRKWMPASFDRRFSNMRFDYEMNEWTEGYYRTTYNFIRRIVKDIHEGGISYAIENQNLSETEKANLKRTAVEVAHFALCIIAISALYDDDDDDSEDGYVRNMLEYQTRRLYTELGSMIPLPTILSEFFRILKSPMASISTLEQTANLLELAYPSSWTTEYQSGKHKGELKAKVLFLKSPFGIFYSNIENALNPEESIAFYK